MKCDFDSYRIITCFTLFSCWDSTSRHGVEFWMCCALTCHCKDQPNPTSETGPGM